MSCYYPLLARRICKNDEGKEVIKFIPNRVDYNINYLRKIYGDRLMLLPCGHCLGCLFDKARDWATRAVCEMAYHKEACFVTLTYDDKHCPKKLKRSDLIDFIKLLRNRGVRVRYLGCGEYGTITHRPHYHVILFGFCPDDLVLHSRNSKGESLYESKSLAALWEKGFVLVGDCTFRTAGYVARYTTKKLGDEDAFIVVSNRPGLGYQYYLDHASEMVKDGFVYGDFGDSYKAPIPRYFEKFLLNDYPEEYQKLIDERIQKTLLIQNNELLNHKFSNPEELKIYNARILDRKLQRFERS